MSRRVMFDVGNVRDVDGDEGPDRRCLLQSP